MPASCGILFALRKNEMICTKIHSADPTAALGIAATMSSREQSGISRAPARKICLDPRHATPRQDRRIDFQREIL